MPDECSVSALIQRLQRLLHLEATGGIILMIAAVAALIWANSPQAHSYHALWHLTLGVGAITPSLHFIINDGLMTVFFLIVGMEIRREIHDGALSHLRAAGLPILAALGGVAVPALIYLAFNHDPLRHSGWAIPAATDIAFALGVLALLGRGIPASVRVLLLALAVIDDIIAVLIIALFYSDGLALHGFAIAGAGLLWVGLWQRLGIDSAWAYVLPGAILWLGIWIGGAHPTLAGVVLGMVTPVRVLRQPSPPVVRVPVALHPWVAYGILPLFALANAGVSLDGIDLSAGGARGVTLGVALALVLGKPLGVIGVSALMVRLGVCRLPPGVSWGGIVLIGLLAGIGFTMSIFIAMLAFDDPALLEAAKLGVLAGSLVAALLGLAWGVLYRRTLRGVTDD